MKKMFLFIIPLLLMCVTMSYAQTLTLKTNGLSPRDVANDTLSTPKYFDRTFNGLQNVGNQTKVFLKAAKSTKFTSPVWAFTSKPAGSAVYDLWRNRLQAFLLEPPEHEKSDDD